jgi:hypothetical protein
MSQIVNYKRLMHDGFFSGIPNFLKNYFVICNQFFETAS